MRKHSSLRAGLACLALAALVFAQAPPVMVFPEDAKPQQPPPPPKVVEAPKPAPASASPAAAQQGTLTEAGGFLLQNVSLVELIDILAKRMKINYILDPRVKGSVTINTYGEVRAADLMPLMQTILRINGATIVKVGELYRIIPLPEVSRMPIAPVINGRDLPEDERTILNLVFLKYATVDEMAKLLEPFIGEGARVTTYPPANLLLMLDNARNMRRTMDLLAMFDSDSFAGQRVRLLEVTHGRPVDIAKEMESVFKAYALSDKSSSVRFLPIDRINTIIAVAPNPGIFAEVEKWLKKLDVQAKVTAGSVDNYVYRLKYGRAETVAMAIMALYSGNPMAMMGMMAGMMGGGMGGGMYGGGMGGGMYGGGMYGGGMGGMYGGGMGGMYGGGMGGGGYGGYGGMAAPYSTFSGVSSIPYMQTAPAAAGAGVTTPGVPDLTGSYLGATPQGQQQRVPHIIPNPFDNTLLIQGTPQEWDQISKLLRQLDVPPRQVLIQARIYEVDLTGAFASGVAAALKKVGTSNDTSGGGSGTGGASAVPLSRTLIGIANGAGLTLSAGLLAGRSRELLGILTLSESSGRSKVLSEPSVIATDSIPATINVGEEVPTLSATSASGVQQSGSSLFANTIQNRNAGVTLAIMARVNSSGIVTLIINQEVSTPVPPAASAFIQSPSFSKRTVNTQVTVQDGDTIAIGGIIQESETHSSSGVPFLHRLPVVGAAFGNRNITKARTELVVFLTPRVIYDTNQISDASDELTGQLKRLQKMIKDE